MTNNHSNVELYIFDWDGTLADSIGTIEETFLEVCRDLDMPPISGEQARYTIGMDVREALVMLFPDVPETQYERLQSCYRNHFLARAGDIKLFAGVEEGLLALRAQDRRLALATGKSRRGLDFALNLSGIGGLFAASRCADECGAKPDPRMLIEILEELNVRPEHAIMIGDTVHDLKTARNAGIEFLGVGYGAHAPHYLRKHGASLVLDSFAEVIARLTSR